MREPNAQGRASGGDAQLWPWARDQSASLLVLDAYKGATAACGIDARHAQIHGAPQGVSLCCHVRRDLERKLKAVLSPSQVARLTADFTGPRAPPSTRPAPPLTADSAGGGAADSNGDGAAANGGAGGRRQQAAAFVPRAGAQQQRARKGARYYAALEQLASQQVRAYRIDTCLLQR